jgi:ABC-type glycerol-3-phosphate transport system substrate-binding protein
MSAASDAIVMMPTSARGGGRVTITFAVLEEERPLYEALIERFEQDTPEIHVQLVNSEMVAKTIVTPDGTFSHDEASLRETLSIADTAALGVTAEAITKGWVYDLRPLMDADPSFDSADFHHDALALAGQNGQIYTLPHTLWIELLSYNKALWTARGLAAPSSGWRWTDLLAAAEQLTQKRGTHVDVYGIVDWDIWAKVLRHDLTAVGVDPASLVHLDQSEMVMALEHVARLAEAGTIYLPPSDSNNPSAFQSLIRNQQVGIWPADMLDRTPLTFEIGTVPAPSASVGVDGYIMSAGTQYPQQAWRWLSFLSREMVRRPAPSAGNIGQVPARKSIAEQSGYWQQLDAETTTAIEAVLNRGSASSLPDFDLRSFLLLRDAVIAVVRDKRPADMVLRDAQATLEQQLAQQPQPSPGPDIISVATPVPVAPSGATTITFGTPRSNIVQVRQLADRFNGRNLGVFVEVKNSDTPDGPLALTELAAKMDCFAESAPPSQAEQEVLLDLQPLIDADMSFSLSDYPPPLLTPFRQGGGLYGLPYAVEFRVLNYNPISFDTAHLAYPTAAWSLDDFLNAAHQLTHGTGNTRRYGFASTVWSAQDVFFFLDRFDAVAIIDRGDGLAPHFTDPRVLDAVRFYVDFLRATSPHTRLHGYTRDSVIDDAAIQRVATGRVGMWFDFGAKSLGVEPGGYQGFVPAIAPPPLAQGGVTANDFSMRGLSISVHTQHPEACWSWLKELSSDLSILAGTFPARRSLAESNAFMNQAPIGAQMVYQAYLAAFERTSDTGSASARGDQDQLDYYWFFRAIDRGLQGKDVERELADAQRMTEEYLDCVRSDVSGSVCVTLVDPEYHGQQLIFVAPP